MKISGLKRCVPSWKNAALAVLSAILLILAFPGFEWSFTAWFALIPLLVAVEREKESARRSFVTGWLFGTCFFFGACWWLTFPPVAYAGFPVLLAYFLLVCVCLAVGLFPAVFAALLSVLLKRLGTYAILSAPFIWIFTEFLRFWTTGNNWNAIAYSQAFDPGGLIKYAGLGGIYLVGFLVLLYPAGASFIFLHLRDLKKKNSSPGAGNGATKFILLCIGVLFVWTFVMGAVSSLAHRPPPLGPRDSMPTGAIVIALQPNVPMSGLDSAAYNALKARHMSLTKGAFQAHMNDLVDENLSTFSGPKALGINSETATSVLNGYFRERPKIIIFPESPMNFMYEDDKEFREWVRDFAVENNASVLFNAAEPDPANKKYFNSAVMVDRTGKKVAQYDKIYLLPFGETVPAPLQSIVPALVGSFSYGREYDLLPFGEAKGGVMICFESHFPNLSREYVNEGADVLIEMTNDGYLGPTPVLRQHLANAVFRAVETNRPLLRVTNVGISAYIDERGEVIEPTAGYTEDTRIWSVSKSDGGKTFYVKYGDWFAWVCSIFTVALLGFGLTGRPKYRAG